MCICWPITLLGGLGVHVLEHFNGKRLEAYCRLRRKPQVFGQILDGHEEARNASQYLLVFGLVIGSIAAAGWFGQFGVSSSKLDVADNEPRAWFSWGAVWLFLLTLSALWLPRMVARYSSSLFLFHTWPLWSALLTIARPFLSFGDVFSWVGRRLSDAPNHDNLEEETLEDEIRTMVTAGQRDGVFAEGIPEMIQGVMQLDENDVEGIMTPRSMVDVLNAEAPWEDVLKTVADCGRTRIPVYRGTLDNIVGILFVKDILTRLADSDFSPGTGTLESLLRKPWFIPANKSVDELLRVFLHNRNHMAIVVDKYQQFAGVVTIEDALEEIVGEITDELDIDEESDIIYDEQNHQVEAEGKVPIESLAKLLGLELPESDDYDTIGGLIVHRLSRIPKQGTELELPGVKITVLQASTRTVQRVRLELVKRS